MNKISYRLFDKIVASLVNKVIIFSQSLISFKTTCFFQDLFYGLQAGKLIYEVF